VRVDAHAAYPPDYLSRLVDAYDGAGADSVTVSMRAVSVPNACFQRAAACAQNSVLGAGGSPHRKAGARRWTDHGHHALFKLSAFRAAGGYDESFTHNEDAEFDVRLAANGGRVLLAADIVIDYYPRATARALALQYFAYGRGRAKTVLKHATAMKPRQLAPALVAPAAAAAMLTPLALWTATPAALWLGLCFAYGAWLGARQGSLCAALAGAPAAIMHLAWSAGFIRQLASPATRTPKAQKAPENAL
jgi:succinoglycan biosynthesis protein ExoA